MEKLYECFGVAGLIQIGLVIALFLFSYLVYRFILFSVRKAFATDSLTRQISEALKYPLLFLFFVIASYGTLHLFSVVTALSEKIVRLQIILVMIAFGWSAAGVAHVLFTRAMKRYQDAEMVSYAARSTYTQLIFLKKLTLIVITVLTVSTILLTIPYIKNIGIGLLGSAGILGIALGIAARPIFLNVMAGFQIAFTKMIQIGDAVFVEGESARIENIHLTHVIARTWDLRRIIFPISFFIDKPFQNWDVSDPELVGTIFIYCDYSIPMDDLRTKAQELVEASTYWNRRVFAVHVTNASNEGIEVRIIMSAKDSVDSFALRCEVREKLIKYLSETYQTAFPMNRYKYTQDVNDKVIDDQR